MNFRQTFGKSKKVTGKKSIQSLFAPDNEVVFQYPFRVVFKKQFKPTASNCRILVLASKKKISKSTKRNRLKRQIKELFRLNQHHIIPFLADKNLYIDIAVSYVGKEDLNFHEHQKPFITCLEKLKLILEQTV